MCPRIRDARLGTAGAGRVCGNVVRARRRAAEAAGYGDKAHLRGLMQAAVAPLGAGLRVRSPRVDAPGGASIAPRREITNYAGFANHPETLKAIRALLVMYPCPGAAQSRQK
jgi:hypothetical protein